MNIFMLTLYQWFVPDDTDARYQQTAHNIKRCMHQCRRKPRIIQIRCTWLNTHQLKWSQAFWLIERPHRLCHHIRRQACHQHSGICLIFFVVRHFAQQCVRTNQDYRYNQTVCHQFHNCFHAIIVSSASLHIQSLRTTMFCSTIKYALGIGQAVRQRVLVP